MEFCLEDPDGDVVNLTLTNTGGQRYLVNGVYQADEPEPMVGTAEVIGGKVYMTLTYSGRDPIFSWGGVSHVVLDLPALSGTMESFDIEHDSNNADPENATVRYEAWPVWKVPCP
jgi:hypothetical protein